MSSAFGKTKLWAGAEMSPCWALSEGEGCPMQPWLSSRKLSGSHALFSASTWGKLVTYTEKKENCLFVSMVAMSCWCLAHHILGMLVFFDSCFVCRQAWCILSLQAWCILYLHHLRFSVSLEREERRGLWWKTLSWRHGLPQPKAGGGSPWEAGHLHHPRPV